MHMLSCHVLLHDAVCELSELSNSKAMCEFVRVQTWKGVQWFA